MNWAVMLVANRRAGHKRHAGLLHDRRERQHVAARDGADDHRHLVVLHQALDQGHGLLWIGLVVVHNELDLVLAARSLVVLDRGFDALQVGTRRSP